MTSRPADPLPSLRAAVQRTPQSAEAQFYLACGLQDAGLLVEAEAGFRRTLALAPAAVAAHVNLGTVQQKLGRLDEAEASFRRAIELQPAMAEAHHNLAGVHSSRGRLAEAEAGYRRALQARPDYPSALNQLGNVLRHLGRLEEAAAPLRRAVELKPDFVEGWSSLGVALHAINRFEEAETAYRRALALDPHFGQAHSNLGTTLLSLGRFAEAEAAFERALAAQPDFALAHSNLLFLRQHHSDYTPQQGLADAKAYGEMVGRGVSERYTRWLCDPDPPRLRVGLVSGDLYDHVVGYFLEGVILALDPARIELLAYPTQMRETPLTARIKPRFAAWRPLHGLDDEQAARTIHADGVHVLIDLSGHTGLNRLPVFAWKPAPVQATWIGYFATTGVEEIDYFLTDRHLIPPEDEGHFTETPWRMPASACLTPPPYAIEPNAPPVLTEGVFTFGCFNNLRKVTDEVVALWASILLAAPNTRLFLKAPQLGEASAQAATLRRFAAHGIGADRLVLEGRSPREEYLRAYHRVDAALDPFPYTGATTTAEGFWMGVPAITLKGDRFLSHVGEAAAHRAGLSDWIAADKADYLAKAAALAADPSPLVPLRAALRARVLDSPLFDGARFAHDLEQALWDMWRERRAALSPEALATSVGGS